MIQRHRIALARELTAAMGVPLRDRWGFASSDKDVLAALQIVEANPQDPVTALGIATMTGGPRLAKGGLPLDDEDLMQLVSCLIQANRRTVHLRG